MIKPGTVCYVVRLVGTMACMNGHVVTAARPALTSLGIPCWIIEPHLRDSEGFWWYSLVPQHLLPLATPGEQVETKRPIEVTA